MNFCSKCSLDDCCRCCGIVKNRGLIAPAYLTQYDINNIKKGLKLQEDAFIYTIKHHLTNKLISFIKINDEKGCIFFDLKQGRCKIYKYRPLDCRLFPIDIKLIEKRYWWVLYEYVCPISEKEINSILEFGETQFLPLIRDRIEEYASIEMQLANFKKIKPLPLEY